MMSKNTTHYVTHFMGARVTMSADFSQAADNIKMKWSNDHDFESTAYQVASFGHMPWKALRHFLEEIVEDSGDSAEDFEAEIDKAMEAAAEVYPNQEEE